MAGGLPVPADNERTVRKAKLRKVQQAVYRGSSAALKREEPFIGGAFADLWIAMVAPQSSSTGPLPVCLRRRDGVWNFRTRNGFLSLWLRKVSRIGVPGMSKSVLSPFTR